MDEQEFAELAAGAALHALSPADRAAFDAARREHPEWEHLVQVDAATAAALADGVAETAPPPELRAKLLSQLASTPQLPATDDGPVPDVPPAAAPAVAGPTKRRRWTRGLLTLAASVVLLVGIGVGAVMISTSLNPPAVVALQQIEDAPDARSATADVTDGGTATAHWSESVGKAVLVSDALPPIAQDESFELWFVRDGAAVAAGTFEPSDQTTALLEGTMQSGDAIAVTVEPQGGSPTGQPSSEPIVVIPTS